MILIITQKYDLSTKDVAQWIYFYKEDFIIVYPDDSLTLTKVNDDWLITLNKNKEFLLSQIKKTWYRRGYVNFSKPQFSVSKNTELQYYISEYTKDIMNFIIHKLEDTSVFIGKYGEGNQNKLTFLERCKLLDIKHPMYTVCNTKEQVLEFKKKFPKIITKSLGVAFQYWDNKKLHSGYTHLFNSSDFDKIPLTFASSFIQEYVDKLYELRVFYLKGQLFTTAILSQNSEKSKVDFREGYSDSQMRFCQYKLPLHIEQQIIKLMNSLEHETGSLDLIYSTKKEYIFLELNPIGQFGGNSDVCNYRIEKIIANELRN